MFIIPKGDDPIRAIRLLLLVAIRLVLNQLPIRSNSNFNISARFQDKRIDSQLMTAKVLSMPNLPSLSFIHIFSTLIRIAQATTRLDLCALNTMSASDFDDINLLVRFSSARLDAH